MRLGILAALRLIPPGVCTCKAQPYTLYSSSLVTCQLCFCIVQHFERCIPVGRIYYLYGNDSKYGRNFFNVVCVLFRVRSTLKHSFALRFRVCDQRSTGSQYLHTRSCELFGTLKFHVLYVSYMCIQGMLLRDVKFSSLWFSPYPPAADHV